MSIQITVLDSVNDSVERSYAVKRGISNAKARRDSKIRRDLRKTYRFRQMQRAALDHSFARKGWDVK